MKSRLSITLALMALLGTGAPPSVRAQSEARPFDTAAKPDAASKPQEDEAQDRGWPRKFEAEEHEIVIHQPQVDEWPEFARITFRAALSVAKKGEEETTYGVIRVSAATKVSVVDRLVLLSDRKLEEVTFADVEDAEAKRLAALVAAALPPAKPMTISLDRVISQMDVSQVPVRQVDVNLAPPKIIASDVPAVMVIFLGKPRFKPVTEKGGGDLMFSINTNWDLFLEPASSKHYLLNGKSWLVTGDLMKGPWTAAQALPAALNKLPADENWSDVRAAIPLAPAKDVPVVHVSQEPTELIVTTGAPEFEPIPGTKLMLVANTESDLFYESTQKQYYLLAAGRWFKTGALAGPWTAASASLPEDFQKIPEDSAAADVLACVPGTDAAKEAMILASIPEKATVSRSDLTVTVTYDGQPQFKPIETTTVQYAYNSPFNVFLVEGKYYCCHDAVWFVAPTATGAWSVCDKVPAAIYTIPPTSPKHNVTYVVVYESTPTTVVTGYTSGYSGQTVAATGAVMFGLGILVGAALDDDDDCCWGYHYHSCGFSYGCGAYYHGGCGGYVSGGAVYGPYGGAGGFAGYNSSTGTYSRGAYAYGPNGAAGYRTAYNPSTGTAGYRAGGSNAYGSWTRGAVSNGDEWVRGGTSSGQRGTVGAIQGSGGGAAVRAEGKYGNGATIARTGDGDMYAGKDGNVYKKTDSGWEQTAGKGRSSSTKSAPSAQPASQPAAKASSTAGAKSGAPRPVAAQAPQQAGNLEKESAARSRGESRATRTQQFKSSGQRSAPQGGRSRSGGGRRG